MTEELRNPRRGPTVEVGGDRTSGSGGGLPTEPVKAVR